MEPVHKFCRLTVYSRGTRELDPMKMWFIKRWRWGLLSIGKMIWGRRVRGVFNSGVSMMVQRWVVARCSGVVPVSAF